MDFLLQRSPFSHDAELLFQEIEADRVIGYVTATTWWLIDLKSLYIEMLRSLSSTFSIKGKMSDRRSDSSVSRLNRHNSLVL